MQVLSHILGFFQEYGYWILFFGVMLENAGIPVPGETVLLAAGAYAHEGYFRLPVVWLVSFCGAVIGDNCGYWAGRILKRRFIESRASRFVPFVRHQQRVGSYFRKYGPRTVVVARFITGLRVFTALLAGVSGMAWRPFLACNALGAALWSTSIGSLGYLFGRNWEVLERTVGWAGALLLFAAILFAISLAARKVFSPE